MDKAEITKESERRIGGIQFGDPITNICAGEGNPHRHSYFVARDDKSYKSSFGIRHTDRLVKCTNRKGKFWLTGIDVIYPGHLTAADAAELYAPVWQAQFGKLQKEPAQ